MGRHKKEVWKTIKLPKIKEDYYEVSSWGNVRTKSGKVLKPYPDKDGYLKYTLSRIDGKKRHFFAHRLVAIHFIPNPENKPQVNHLRPWDKTNNYYEHLEWATVKENIAHSIRLKLGTIVTCEAHGMHTVTNEDVHKICKLMEEGKSNKEIIDIFGITGKKKRERFRGVIKHIRARKTWVPISRNYKF